jgi:hypothetical protein
MKYFTPELFVKYQEYENEQAFLNASEAWEQAAQGYEAHLKEIAPLLADGALEFVSLGSLHDASVLGMWHTPTQLTIVLQEERRANQLLILTYSLVDPPYLDPAALPEKYRSPQADWLYDEIDVERGTLFDVTARIQLKSTQQSPNPGEQPRATVYTHAILLSNGWELRLRFYQLAITRPTALLPNAPRFHELSPTSIQRSA